MYQTRLKSGSVPGWIWASRSVPQNHESGPAPKSHWRATLCVPCRLPPSAQFPRGLRSAFWFSALARQLWRNSHRRSVANGWLPGKRSRPNSCIFPFSRLTLVFSRSTISPCCWKTFFVVFVVSSQPRQSRLGVGPGTLGFEDPLLHCALVSHSWVIQGLPPKLRDQVREHTEALELCVMTLDVWCRSFPSRPFFFVAPEDRGGQLHKGPASI